MKAYELLSRFQYRTPLLSIDAMNELLRAINKEGPAPALRAFFFQPLIAEALYIGSGSLFERFKVWAEFGIEDKNDEERLLLSLLKYAIRMSARCTPFGLFAGVGTGNWSSHEHNFVLTSPSKVCKHISLDADYVYNISLTIQEQYPEIKLTLRYFSNTTLFKVGNSFRYISYTLTARRRIYQLQTVGWSAYLEKVIEACRSGQTASDIIQLLLTFEVSAEEATLFFFQLIDNQLLVSELEPRIGDGDYFEQAYERMIHNPELNTLPALFPVRNEFARIKESVSSLTPNHPNFLDFPGAYDRLKFQQLTPRIPVQHHFLVNSTRPAVEASLNSRIGGSLRKALSLLNFLTFKSADNTLTEFRTQFKQRYEDRAVPLLEVLDPEIGIASHYNAVARDEHPFLVGFNFDGTSSRSENTDLLSWNPGYGMLLKKLIHEKAQAPYVLHIEEEDLKTFTENWEDTPVTLQAHFSLVHVDGTDKVLFIGSPYASGLNMINRFTHIDAGTERISQALTQREAEAQKDVLVAELMHTPAYPRKLNVLQHRSTRACEIPFLGLVSKNCSKTIFLDDLYLKVVKNRFVLYSANHDAEVQVMLSTAIRYSLESHPIYHFLGDLQYQNKLIPLKFDWGPLRKIYRFLPRVCYKDVIISQATWVFSAAEILDSNGKLNVEAARFFQKTNGIPDQVELITGDNTLFIDFSHDFCARLFCQHCQKYGEITIREFLPPAKQWAILDEHGMSYRTELVAFFMRRTVEQTIKPVKLLTTAPQPPVSLDVFSDWIYFKIYCGTQGGEDLLIEYLLPLAEALLQEKVIKKWFFIRYNDEGYHIRVRFHLQQKEDKILLLNRMGTQMEIPIQKRIIHKIRIETYYPEIGRYGEDNMERTEHLFFIDSMAVLSALANLRLNGDENLRWQFMIWFGNQLLDDFGLLTKEKIALMEKLLAANGKNDNQRVNAMYKTLNPGISDILSPEAGEKIFGKLLNDLAARKSEDMRKIISGLSFTSVDRYAYIGSFLHMMINRFSLGRPNHHEIVLYNYLLKYYKTKAREN